MKKIFTLLLTALVLNIGIGWAATYNLNFKWKDGVSSMGHMKEFSFWEADGDYVNAYQIVQLTFAKGFAANGNSVVNSNPAITLYLVFDVNGEGNGNVMNYGSITFPGPATYTVETNSAYIWYPQIVDFGSLSRRYYYGYYVNEFTDGNGTEYYSSSSLNSKAWYKSVSAGSSNFNGGSITSTVGVHGYPTFTGTLTTKDGNTVNVTIDAKYTYNIATSTNNIAWGTASANLASIEEGGSVTLTATPSNTGRFVQWSDGNTDNPRIVTLDGNAGSDGQTFTFTATFEAGAAADGTITVLANNDSYGTVSGGGSGVGGSTKTISATANDGYAFTQWNDGNTENPRTVTIDGDKTYTATFVAGISIVTTEGTIHGNQGKSWIQIWSDEKDGYQVKFSIYTALASSTEDLVISGTSNFNNGSPYTYVKTPSGDYTFNNPSVILDYDEEHRVARLRADLTATDGNFYHIDITTNRIYNVYSGNYGLYVMEDGDTQSNFGNYSLPATTPNNNLWMISQDNSNHAVHLHFNPKTDGYGVVPSGNYNIEGTGNDGTIDVGSYPLGELDIYGSFGRNISGNNYWFLRYGNVTVTNIDEIYYVVVDGYNSWDNTVKATMGTAPVDVIVNNGSNGSATVTLNAVNWGEQIPYETGVANKFFAGNQLLLTATPASGYRFVKWSDENTDANRTYTVSGAVTLTPEFELDVTTHTITINPTTNGTLTVTGGQTAYDNRSDGATIDAEEGATLSVTATPATGYHFSAWTNDGAASVTVDGNKTIGATFAIDQYAVVFKNGETVLQNTNVNYGSTPAYAGATPTKAATAEYEYTFSGWTDGVNNYGLSDPLPAVTGAVTYTALFDASSLLCTVTINTPENGTLLVKDGNGQTVTNGSTVSNTTTLTVTATPASGYKFTGWTDNGAASITLNGENTITIGATFAALATYTLTLDYNDNGKIVVTGDGNTYESKKDKDTEITVYEGKEYTCTLVPEDDVNGWGFWTDEDYSYTVNSNQTIKITPTEDIKLHSIFGLKRVELNGKLGAQYYEDNYNDKWVHELVYLRTFKAKDWQAMWMPFPIDIEYQGLDGILYTLSKSEIQEQANGIIDVALSFHRLDNGILNAGDLCLFYSKQAVTDFVFKDITFPYLKADMAPNNTYVGEGNAKVNFFGQTTYSNIGGVGEEALQKSYRYLKDNVLYYPKLNSGVKMQAYNGYWQIDNYNYWYAGGASSAPRLRIIVDGEEITEAGMEDEVEVTKYINEEGILIIERNGVKYTATGAIIQ